MQYTQKTIQLSEVKLNPDNPRTIEKDKLEQLTQSIADFPQMLELRPIVVDEDMMILGGNMRYRACEAMEMAEISVVIVEGLTNEQKREFVIKDNLSGGEWDWEVLKESWYADELSEWGLNLPSFDDGEDFEGLNDIEAGVVDPVSESEDYADQTKDGNTKAIKVYFDHHDYPIAKDLVKRAKNDDLYLGEILIQALQDRYGV